MANDRRRDRDDDFDDDRPARRRPRDEYDDRDDYADAPGGTGARRGPVGKGVNVCGVISLIMGIIGALISLFPCIGVFVGGPIAIIGLILGLIGILTSGKTTGRGLPVAGTCVSVVALLIGGGQLLFIRHLGKKGQEVRIEMEEQARVAQEQARLMQEENDRKERELRDGPALKVTAEKLFEDFDKNPLDAEKMYKDKVLEVTGIVLRNDPDAFGRTAIELDSTGDGIIRCEFPREAKMQVDRMKLKAKVVIRGRCVGPSGKDKIKLENCILVSRGKS